MVVRNKVRNKTSLKLAVRTLTEGQMKLLKDACACAYLPVTSRDEYVTAINEALAQVALDRKRLRALIAFVELSPGDPNVTSDQSDAYADWQKLERHNDKRQELKK